MGPIQMHTEANDLAVKRSMYDNYFSNFLVDRPFQMIYAKIQPQAILGFGE